MVVKLIQILKLKGNCQAQVVDSILDMLNSSNEYKADFFEYLYEGLAKRGAIPSEKERFILNSLPLLHIVPQALLAYQIKESMGYLNTVLCFSAETAEFPADYFNEYVLTRGR